MERRRLLRLVTIDLPSGCLGSLPDAMGPRNPPATPAGNPRDTPETSPIRTEDIDYKVVDNGRLRVFGSALNGGGAERLTMIEVRVSVDDECTTQSRELAVSTDGAADFEIEFDIRYDTFSDGGDLNVSLV